ncbi:MAG: efflux RND transporter periplasmic adaptor subunit [Acidobacteria bacterium]|nr:efflux RND transporter periplasmic adaptor subunit [Acidobacteriota bacterium]
MKYCSIGLCLLLLLPVACKRKAPEAAAPAAVKIGAQDFTVAKRDRITTGPTLSGSLNAQTEANVRALISGAVLEVNAQEGEQVPQGKLLARIDPGAFGVAAASAQTAVNSARAALANAEKEQQRQEALNRAGIVARRDVEVARTATANARAQVATAVAQASSTNVQAGNATVESPINGIVSKRLVSKGDVVQVGTTMFTIVDLRTLQLEASVPAEHLVSLQVGTPVQFTIQGMEDKVFQGRISRINPAADPTTRQIQVFAEIPNASGALATGLFAEGRVENLTRIGVIAPASAIDRRMTTPAVSVVRNNRVEHVNVVLGIIDDNNDRVEIRQGVEPGEILLVGASQQLTPGTQVELPAQAHVAGDQKQ